MRWWRTRRPAAAEARRDILFVGALDDDPSPNTDSLLWFVDEIMPLLDGLVGDDWQLLVAGRAGAPRVRRLAGRAGCAFSAGWRS